MRTRGVCVCVCVLWMGTILAGMTLVRCIYSSDRRQKGVWEYTVAPTENFHVTELNSSHVHSWTVCVVISAVPISQQKLVLNRIQTRLFKLQKWVNVTKLYCEVPSTPDSLAGGAGLESQRRDKLYGLMFFVVFHIPSTKVIGSCLQSCYGNVVHIPFNFMGRGRASIR